jgi:hypothetical protein
MNSAVTSHFSTDASPRKRGRPRLRPVKVRAKLGPDNRIVFDPELHCGAQTTSNEGHEPCRNRKGFRTPHPMEGRCWKHGGLTPIKTGIYSKVQGTRLKGLIERTREETANPLAVATEGLIMMRALSMAFLEDHSDLNDRKAILQAANLCSRSISAAGRVHAMTQGDSLPIAAVDRLCRCMAEVVSNVVKDPKLLEQIKQKWGRIQVARG